MQPARDSTGPPLPPVGLTPLPPYDLYVTLPRGRSVELHLSTHETDRVVVLRASEAKTIDVDWSKLSSPPKSVESDSNSGTHAFGWSPTREGLDDPRPLPPEKPKPAK